MAKRARKVNKKKSAKKRKSKKHDKSQEYIVGLVVIALVILVIFFSLPEKSDDSPSEIQEEESINMPGATEEVLGPARICSYGTAKICEGTYKKSEIVKHNECLVECQKLPSGAPSIQCAIDCCLNSYGSCKGLS